MGYNNQILKDAIAYRKVCVSRLRLRGYSAGEIHKNLERSMQSDSGDPCFNVVTEEPWSFKTIQKDLRLMRRSFTEEGSENVLEIKARLFAELEEVKRSAWESLDHNVVLSAINTQLKMTGGDKPLEKRGNEGIDRLSDERKKAIFEQASLSLVNQDGTTTEVKRIKHDR